MASAGTSAQAGPAPPPLPGAGGAPPQAIGPGGRPVGPPRPVTVRKSGPKVGRNAPCPCGSGKKYKFCHGAN
jgi:preprotein translocase subunit SecA